MLAPAPVLGAIAFASAALAMRIDFPQFMPGIALVPRQTASASAPIPSAPAQCVTQCSDIQNFIIGNVECTIATCCTSTFVNNYFGCFTCLGKATNATDYTTQQNLIDQIENQCALEGVPLQKVTFPGQNPSRTLSPVSGAPPSTGTDSGSATNTAPESSTTATGTLIHQSTITAAPATSSISQSTITALPTDTPAPSPSQASGADRLSVAVGLVLGAGMMLGVLLW